MAQNFEQQPLPARLERDDVALAAQNEIADADLVGLVQRLQHDGVAFLGGIAVGKKVIGLLEIAGVDGRRFDEAHELDGLLALELQLVDLLLVEQDVLALLVLVALDDVLVLDRADAGRHLLVADALAGGLVDLVKLDLPLGAGGGIEADRDIDERKP